MLNFNILHFYTYGRKAREPIRGLNFSTKIEKDCKNGGVLNCGHANLRQNLILLRVQGQNLNFLLILLGNPRYIVL